MVGNPCMEGHLKLLLKSLENIIFINLPVLPPSYLGYLPLLRRQDLKLLNNFNKYYNNFYKYYNNFNKYNNSNNGIKINKFVHF